MKAFQQKGRDLFTAQTANKSSFSEVTELSFANCALAPELLSTEFNKLTNLSRITLVDMKPTLNEQSFGAILAALPHHCITKTLRAIDVCDNKITAFPKEVPSFPALVRLIMANNTIDSLETNFTKERFPALRTLDLEDNKAIGSDAASKIFDLLPSLVVFNGKNKQGEDAHDASDIDDDEDGFLDDDEDDEGEGNGDVDAFVDGDSEQDAEEDMMMMGGGSNNNNKLSPSRRERE
jgi:hypothetical protein